MNPLTIAKLAAALGLGAAIFLGGYHVADLKGKAAVASLQHAWDVDKAAIQATADKAIADATKAKEDAMANNDQVTNDLQSQIQSARALNAGLSASLHNYQVRAAANSGNLPKADSDPGAANTPITPSDRLLNDALANAITECNVNRLNQAALIRELTPQL